MAARRNLRLSVPDLLAEVLEAVGDPGLVGPGAGELLAALHLPVDCLLALLLAVSNESRGLRLLLLQLLVAGVLPLERLALAPELVLRNPEGLGHAVERALVRDVKRRVAVRRGFVPGLEGLGDVGADVPQILLQALQLQLAALELGPLPADPLIERLAPAAQLVSLRLEAVHGMLGS